MEMTMGSKTMTHLERDMMHVLVSSEVWGLVGENGQDFIVQSNGFPLQLPYMYLLPTIRSRACKKLLLQ